MDHSLSQKDEIMTQNWIPKLKDDILRMTHFGECVKYDLCLTETHC